MELGKGSPEQYAHDGTKSNIEGDGTHPKGCLLEKHVFSCPFWGLSHEGCKLYARGGKKWGVESIFRVP